jgi:hypothetical protein
VGLEAQACAPGPAIFFPGHLHIFFLKKELADNTSLVVADDVLPVSSEFNHYYSG